MSEILSKQGLILEGGALGIFTGALKSAAAGIGAAIIFSLLGGLLGKAKGKD